MRPPCLIPPETARPPRLTLVPPVGTPHATLPPVGRVRRLNCTLVRALLGRLSSLSVFHSKLVLCGAFVWACRALNSSKRRFPPPGAVMHWPLGCGRAGVVGPVQCSWRHDSAGATAQLWMKMHPMIRADALGCLQSAIGAGGSADAASVSESGTHSPEGKVHRVDPKLAS